MQPQASQWVEHCRETCEHLGVAFECLSVQVDVRNGGVEAAARRARYDAFGSALRSSEVLALAHHADDQAETFLIQALRGAGVAGLAGMPRLAAFAGGYLWRPLLALPHRIVVEYATAHALTSIDDPSNRDTELDRGFIREQLTPVLGQRWPHASTTLSRSAHWCAEAAALVSEVAEADAVAITDAQQRLSVDSLCRMGCFRQSGVLRHWLSCGGYDAPDHRHLRQIQRLLGARERIGPVVHWRDTDVRLFDGHLYAMHSLAPPPSEWTRVWQLGERVELPEGCGQLDAKFDGTTRHSLTVRFRRGGERFVDPRRDGSHTLKKFLQEARVPPWERARLPLIYENERLVAIAGYWLDPELGRRLGVTNLRVIWS